MRKHIFLLPLILFLLPLLCVPAQQEEDTTRQLWDTAFISPAKKQPSKKRTTAKRRYRIATPQIPTVDVAPDTVIGVTVWRLRPAQSADTGERILVQESSESAGWIPERVSIDTKLIEGDRVRLSIEAARTGYLYVIDREQYADGTVSEPYLIFPTRRTRGGNNEVKVGRVIEIPAQDDNPAYFRLRRSRSDQVGEVLGVIVTPTPLEDLEIGDNMLRLSQEQVAQWERSWGTNVGCLEMEKGVGQPWTKEEKEAGANGTRSLKHNEPTPQTVYYRPKVKSDEPVLVKVKLGYGRSGAPAQPLLKN